MRRIAYGAICLCASLLIASCGAPHIAEMDAVSFDKTEFDAQNQQLHLVGDCSSSVYVVYTTSTMQHGSDIVIEMQITMTRKSYRRQGMTAHFDFNVPVPPDAQRVVFGSERTVLWERPKAAAQ